MQLSIQLKMRCIGIALVWLVSYLPCAVNCATDAGGRLHQMMDSFAKHYHDSWIAQNYARSGSLINMVFAGIGACLMAKFAVWLLGFCSNGIRRRSFAAFLMKGNSGKIATDSFIAVMQSIGASGLGPLRAVKIFVTGAVLYLSYRIYCKIPVMKPNGTFGLP